MSGAQEAVSAATSMAPQSIDNTTLAGNYLSRQMFSLPLRAFSSVATLPRHASRLVGLDAMGTRMWGLFGMEGDAAAQAGTAAEAAQDSGIRLADVYHAFRRFSGFFAYLTSRWFLACFAVVSPAALELSITDWSGYCFEQGHHLCID